MKTKFKENKIQNCFLRVGNWLAEAVDKRPFVSCLVTGMLMTLLIYCLHARSPIGGFVLTFSQPWFFLFNALIIITFYSLALFFARRIFVMSLITVIWLTLGITECVLLSLRDLPLEAIDFYIVRTGIAILPVYMGWIQLSLCILAILAALVVLVILFIKSPKCRPDYVRVLLTVVCCLLVLLFLTLAIVGLADADPKNFDNIKDAYDVYGFPYCFLRSIFDRGIPQPDNYSEEKLREIVSELASKPSASPEKTPNIIMVQLESFFDVNRMEDLRFSKNPIPNFTAMGEEGARGLVSVPAFGSGTANTEFEILSGLDLDFFGTGEYPYASILGERCCETVAYNLSALGYSTHSMHNHTGTFYDRYRVYANLGFDTFTPAEHMVGLEYTDLDWEKDKILTQYIIKALTSTESPDFVFAVSVQGHGKYPEVPTNEEPCITLSGIRNEERHNAFEYYINQLYEMDAFIGELKEALSALDEDTVLVLYGDHLPSLDITKDELVNRNLLQTDYVIWNNFDITFEAPDVEAYQLSALIQGTLGIDEGLINKIHREYADTPDYSEILRLVGYDMLYGDQFAFGEEFPYTTRDITLGLDTIAVTGISPTEDKEVFIDGRFFTPYSHVFINGRKVKTIYISEELLFVENYIPQAGDLISVVQISVDLQKLSQTAVYKVSRNDILQSAEISPQSES